MENVITFKKNAVLNTFGTETIMERIHLFDLIFQNLCSKVIVIMFIETSVKKRHNSV